MSEQEIIQTISAAAQPLDSDLDELVRQISGSQLVLIGEASHGTHEFYQLRAQLTQRLISDHGFSAVAVEADWPDATRVGRYARGLGPDQSAEQALGDFTRFPRWMWRNTAVLGFVQWLRNFNEHMPDLRARVGFYGIDLYSLRSSMQAVVSYLQQVDPEAALRARQRYSCFDFSGGDPQMYGYSAALGTRETCEDDVVRQLTELRQRAHELMNRDGFVAEEEYFYAEQNARVVKEAERYYRTMFYGSNASWNLRDTHMADTVDALLLHLQQHHSRGAKVVIWAHNSHLGDARATEMGRSGQLNLGQLMRQRHMGKVTLVGFSTSTGTVAAASDWDSPVEIKQVRPPLSGSYEQLMQRTGVQRFWLNLRDDQRLRTALRGPLLERAIGVIYRPETERMSHYFHTELPSQFDLLLHIDSTSAVTPLDRASDWDHSRMPDTYPSGDVPPLDTREVGGR